MIICSQFIVQELPFFREFFFTVNFRFGFIYPRPDIFILLRPLILLVLVSEKWWNFVNRLGELSSTIATEQGRGASLPQRKLLLNQGLQPLNRESDALSSSAKSPRLLTSSHMLIILDYVFIQDNCHLHGRFALYNAFPNSICWIYVIH